MARIVGIDLGTTNSLVAYMDGAEPRIIADAAGGRLVPSVVSIFDDGRVEVGMPAKRRLLTRPQETIYSIKRFMGKGWEDVREEAAHFPYRISPEHKEVVHVLAGGRAWTPPEISAFILKELKARADAFFGEPVTQAVITVPAYFNDTQRQATKDAGRLAGVGRRAACQRADRGVARLRTAEAQAGDHRRLRPGRRDVRRVDPETQGAYLRGGPRQ